jgi:hypothetical protein
MTPQQIRDQLSGFIQKSGIPRSHCETGEPYVFFKVFNALSADDAMKALCSKLMDYAATRDGILYWRRLPSSEPDHANPGRWRADARMVISSKPELDAEALRSSRAFGDSLIPRNLERENQDG